MSSIYTRVIVDLLQWLVSVIIISVMMHDDDDDDYTTQRSRLRMSMTSFIPSTVSL